MKLEALIMEHLAALPGLQGLPLTESSSEEFTLILEGLLAGEKGALLTAAVGAESEGAGADQEALAAMVEDIVANLEGGEETLAYVNLLSLLAPANGEDQPGLLQEKATPQGEADLLMTGGKGDEKPAFSLTAGTPGEQGLPAAGEEVPGKNAPEKAVPPTKMAFSGEDAPQGQVREEKGPHNLQRGQDQVFPGLEERHSQGSASEQEGTKSSLHKSAGSTATLPEEAVKVAQGENSSRPETDRSLFAVEDSGQQRGEKDQTKGAAAAEKGGERSAARRVEPAAAEQNRPEAGPGSLEKAAEGVQEAKVRSPQQAQAQRESVLQQVTGRLVYLRETAQLPAEMRLTLHPPELGAVTVRVFSRQGQLSAAIYAESALVREILESSVSELRQRFNFLSIEFSQTDMAHAGRHSGSEAGSSNTPGREENSHMSRFPSSERREEVAALDPVPQSGAGVSIEYWA